MRELLKQARDALAGLTSAKSLFLRQDEQLARMKDAWDAEAAIDAELAKPEEKTVPLAMLIDIAISGSTQSMLRAIAKEYGYKVV